MDLYMIEVEIIQEVWRLFKEIIGENNYELYLFGSRSTKTNVPHSDFDFCIVGKKPVPSEKMYRLKQAIEDMKTLYSIDIVDFEGTNEAFKEIAKKEMVRIINGKVRSA